MDELNIITISISIQNCLLYDYPQRTLLYILINGNKSEEQHDYSKYYSTYIVNVKKNTTIAELINPKIITQNIYRKLLRNYNNVNELCNYISIHAKNANLQKGLIPNSSVKNFKLCQDISLFLVRNNKPKTIQK